MHASFFPQLEDLGGEVLVTPAQAAALELLDAMTGARTSDEDDEAVTNRGLRRTVKDMLLFGSKTTHGRARRTHSPGRPDPIPVPDRHFVLGTPLKPPFPEGLQTAVVGMGCFWGAERMFWQAPGVYTTAVGYAGGYTPNPTYEETCSGKTGHTEAVLVVFDPAKISYEEILKRFWEGHDPTQGMRQGNDVGTQYRSAIYTDERPSRPRPSRPPRPPSASA